MIDATLRSQIQNLRSEGISYNEICDRIGLTIPKGTLSYICKDIELPTDYYARKLKAEQERLVLIREQAKIANKRLKIERFMDIYNRAIEANTTHSELNDSKIQLAMLYKGEGAKYSAYSGLSLGSSDPRVLKIYIALLSKCYGIQRNSMKFRIMARADQDLIALRDFWSSELDVTIDNFYKGYKDIRTTGKPTKRLNYRGVCVVSCKGADVQIELDMIANLYADKLWGISSFG